jgi:AcrR family transcriptional regulator
LILYDTEQISENVLEAKMDRRQQRTKDAIFAAFSKLLEKKRYSSISVQEIIDEANIGRSTFYSHFETKDQLLKTMCRDIFRHVFSEDLMSEETHDFSSMSNGLETRLTHLLHHIKDNENNIIGILSCESGELFMKYFKEYLTELFVAHLDDIEIHAPADFVQNYLVGSFSETVKWWIDTEMEYTPEETAGYFFRCLRDR